MARTEPLTTVPDVAEALRAAASAGKRRARPIALDLGALDAILAVDEISGIAHVEVGVTIGRLEEALARSGLTLRHDPALPPEARIGDHLAELSEAVCGLEACLPDGRLMRLRPGPRRAVGPDLVALATLGAPRLLVPCAVHLRAGRMGDEPWVGWFAAKGPGPLLEGARAFLRRGVRTIATELRVDKGGASALRVEVNLPPAVRVASQAIVEDELAAAGAVATGSASWAPFAEADARWLPFGDLARAAGRPPLRIVRFDPWGALVQWTRTAPPAPRTKGPTAAFEALLARLKVELDPAGVL